MAVEWMDQDTFIALKWSEIWSDFTPVTVYGRRAKAAAVPYLPGQEGELQKVWDQLQRDLDTCSPQRVEQVTEQLQNWPDITDALNQLQWQLTAKHLLALKQFAFRGNRLAEFLQADGEAQGHDEFLQADAEAQAHGAAQAQDNAPAHDLHRRLHEGPEPGSLKPGLNGSTGIWTHPSLWRTLLEIFGAPDSSSFSLDHVADDTYRAAAAAHTEAVRNLALVRRQRDRQWSEETGQPVSRDGQLHLSLPEHHTLSEQLKQDGRLRWRHDTPFESVFELLPTEEMASAAAELEECEVELSLAAEALLERLTVLIRRQLPLWREAERHLQELDLRLARVQLTRLWGGSVPQLGSQIGLQGGVHPLVAKQLQQRGRHYVPLNFDPVEGANVVFGSNMGGKTVAMSLLTLSQLCAQFGLPAPAKRFQTRLFPVIRYCASAETDLASGLSSFGTEMTRLAAAWKDISGMGDGLLCLDEPGRSTNPFEGEALVMGVIRAAANLGQRSVLILASHFAAVLREQGVAKFRVRGLQPDWAVAPQVAESGLSGSSPPPHGLASLEEWMDYRLERIEGVATQVTEALPVAEWLGLPNEILRASRQFIQSEHGNV